VLLAAGLAATAILAAGCGSKSSTTTETTSSTVTWANGVCGAAVTYEAALKSAAKSLASSPSKSGLQAAADQVKTATNTFVSTTKGLGKPDTSAGQQAKQTLDTLSTGLNKDVSTIENASGGGVIAGIPVITTALTTAQSQITTAFTQLKGLDAKGELSNAFSQASSCSSFTSS
jgi:hypothetical protein